MSRIVERTTIGAGANAGAVVETHQDERGLYLIRLRGLDTPYADGITELGRAVELHASFVAALAAVREDGAL